MGVSRTDLKLEVSKRVRELKGFVLLMEEALKRGGMKLGDYEARNIHGWAERAARIAEDIADLIENGLPELFDEG